VTARVALVVLLGTAILAGCVGSGGGVPAANLPPAGQELFGTSFNTTTFALTGAAGSFPTGQPVAVVAHLSSKVPEGQTIAITVDGYAYNTGKAGAGGSDVFGIVIAPGGFAGAPGPSHNVSFTDAGGNELASGTVTIR
jgi:hypothetical protein